MTLTQDLHDPGGKVKIKLRENIEGGATFSDCGRYRPLLWRRWSHEEPERRILWIGMNPSTADASVDDPTVRRECDFSALWGMNSYRKCNVMDYRATDQTALRGSDVRPCSDHNLDIILNEARAADRVILVCGSLHKTVSEHGSNVVNLLQANRIEVMCMGLTDKGYPKHPLYLKKTTIPVIFDRSLSFAA